MTYTYIFKRWLKPSKIIVYQFIPVQGHGLLEPVWAAQGAGGNSLWTRHHFIAGRITPTPTLTLGPCRHATSPNVHISAMWEKTHEGLGRTCKSTQMAAQPGNPFFFPNKIITKQRWRKQVYSKTCYTRINWMKTMPLNLLRDSFLESLFGGSSGGTQLLLLLLYPCPKTRPPLSGMVIPLTQREALGGMHME